jgi:hypothetical protein
MTTATISITSASLKASSLRKIPTVPSARQWLP